MWGRKAVCVNDLDQVWTSDGVGDGDGATVYKRPFHTRTWDDERFNISTRHPGPIQVLEAWSKNFNTCEKKRALIRIAQERDFLMGINQDMIIRRLRL